MTNDAVRGYIVLTLKKLGKNKEEIDRVLAELHFILDTTSESEAEDYYFSRKWQ